MVLMKKKRGFTLIELLMVVVIMSLVTLAAGAMLTTFLRGASRAEVRNRVKGEGSYVAGLIERKIRESESVDNCSTANMTLVLDGDTLNPTSLVSNNVVMSGVGFNCSMTGGITTVDYSFTVRQTAGEGQQSETQVSETFSGSVTLRSSYK